MVTDYLAKAGLQQYLDAAGFNLVGYGCTTCIGNSGPLPDEIAAEVRERGLVVCSVLSGNRNFEGRIQQDVRANYLASPPLVVAYALTGTMNVDLTTEPIGKDKAGKYVYLKDLWPSEAEIQQTMLSSLSAEMFRSQYASVFDGDARWKALPVPTGNNFAWEADSTYVRKPPFLEHLSREPKPLEPIAGARALAVLGDSITTDHISPAGAIKADSPAGKYLLEKGVAARDFNSYGARRGNHEVMMRGTFANVRLRNQLAPGTEGGFTTLLPDGAVMSIFEAAEKYRAAGVPLIVIAGKEYGSGSSRDWAAKGTMLLGREGRDLGELRTHPSQQPGQHGCAAAGVCRRRDRDDSETHRARGVRSGGHRRRTDAAIHHHGARPARRRLERRVQGPRAYRHAGRADRVPARRHPAVRAAPARIRLKASRAAH